MKNINKTIINQSIPNEFSSTLINYKVEVNPNIHYNYNQAEITAIRQEKIREEQENQKRKKISECMNKCKQNIIKYNQEKLNETNKINESMSSVQRGKEYNENLRKQMKLKAEKKKNKKMNNKQKENEVDMKNYEEEVMPTFSFKEQQQTENVDMDGNAYNEFYNNNNDNLLIKDLTHNIESQIQENSYNGSPFVTKTFANNFQLKNSNMGNYNNNLDNNINPRNLFDNNNLNNSQQKIYHNSKNNFNNKDINIQEKINNNISLIQKFRQTGSLQNDNKESEYNYNYIENNNYEENIPIPQPIITPGKIIRNQNDFNQQNLYMNAISSIKSGINNSTHLNTNTSNFTNNAMNESNMYQNKYSHNNNPKKNNSSNYKSPYEMNELQQKRYKKALRKLVIDRFNSKKIDIPSICSCGQLQRKIDSLLNDNKLITQDDLMNVDCANNCIYYQKPGSYHRALTDIIQSIRTLQLENGIRK